MRPFSKRLGSVAPSQTTAFTAMVAAERRKGRRIIDLSVGEYTGPAPEPVLAATRSALAEGRYRYGPVAGVPALRTAIARRHRSAGDENVIVTNGAKQALYLLFQAVCDPGAEVIIPTPCWVSFPQMVRLAGGRPVMVPCADGHQLDVARIQDAVTDRTCAILINSPNNPTGAVYPASALAALARTAGDRGLLLVSDETYADLVYDDAPCASVSALSERAECTVLVGSFSKSFTMTGFRVGYAVGPKPLIEAMSVIQSHACGNVCTFAQHGALAALALPDAYHRQLRETLAANRALALETLRGALPCPSPAGAFYLFPDISAILPEGGPSGAFCADMLSRTGVAIVPGEAFGAPSHVRISFAVDRGDLREGLKRMVDRL